MTGHVATIRQIVFAALVCSLAAVTAAGAASARPASSASGAPSRAEAAAGNSPSTSSSWVSGVRGSLARREYEATAVTGHDGLQAPNRAQNLRTYFTSGGIRVEPRRQTAAEPAWSAAWTLRGVGRGAAVRVSEPVMPQSLGAIVQYVRPGVHEWYVNAAEGVEQGFTLAARPDGSGELALELAVAGTGVTPRLSREGDALDFLLPGGARALRYAGLAVRDADGIALPARLEFADGTLRLLADDHDARYPIVLDPLISSPVWTALGNQAGEQLGDSVACAGDVNGDGYSDVIVGAPYYDNGQTDEGAAFVFYGSTAGLGSIPGWIAESNQAGANMGVAVASAGDVNGDGYDDVIVGGYRYESTAALTDEGGAWVYLGGPDGLNAAPVWSYTSGQALALLGNTVGSAGDVNGDGFDDVVVSAPYYDDPEIDEGRALLFLGSTNGPVAAPSWITEGDQVNGYYGAPAAGAGDVNADGYDDVIVGAFHYTNGQSTEGKAWVYLGGVNGLSTTAVWTREGNQGGASYGHAVAAAGDVNGDGYGDIIVGGSRYSSGEQNEGRVWVYYGSVIGPDTLAAWTVQSNATDARLGCSVACAGDVNGDGFADVIVGAWQYEFAIADEGGSFVYQGTAAGLDTLPDWTFGAGQTKAFSGWSVSGAGDVNGDGYSDVIVGAPLFDDPINQNLIDVGKAFVFYGAPAGVDTLADWSFDSQQGGAQFGYALSAAGDVNGDGYTDVVVGAPYWDNGQTDEGRAFVFRGSAKGITATSVRTVESNQGLSQFGAAVAGAGDVNGDGYADVLVGCPAYDNGQTDEGRAFLYLGTPSGISLSASWTAELDQAGAGFGFAVTGIGDTNADGFGDIAIGAPYYDNGQTDEGGVWVYLGSTSGPAAAADWHAEGDQTGGWFGSAVAGAGDINGDSYSDLLIAARLYDPSVSLVDAGRVLEYHGSNFGPSSAPNWTLDGTQSGAVLGWSIASAGDVNGDGYADIVIGQPLYSGAFTSDGRAQVILGGLNGLRPTAAWTDAGGQANSQCGFAVAGVGDTNGDGFGDVVVGTPYYDNNGNTDVGRLQLFRGNSTGVNSLSSNVWYGDQGRALFGNAVAAAGDLNGDGSPDFVTAAYLYDLAAKFDEGRIYAFYGNLGPGLDRAVMQWRLSDTAPIAVLGASEDATSFRLRANGRSILGRGQVRMQWEVKPIGVPFDGTGLGTGALLDTGAPGTGGSIAHLDEVVSGLTGFTMYKWRIRLVSDARRFQARSVWLSIPQVPRTQGTIRTARPTAVGTPGEPATRGLALTAPAPNPAPGRTTLRYRLATAGNARLRVFDAAGRALAALADGPREAGEYRAEWRGVDDAGRRVPAGLYLVRLDGPGGTRTQRVVLTDR